MANVFSLSVLLSSMEKFDVSDFDLAVIANFQGLRSLAEDSRQAAVVCLVEDFSFRFLEFHQ